MNLTIAESGPGTLSSDLVFEDTGGCISTLKHIPPGKVWSEEDIRTRKESMLYKGREWLVVDNLVVHEEIKLGGEDTDRYIRNYKQTLINLFRCGIKVVCYNFMPVFYKVRTHFSSSYPNRHVFSLFDPVAFSAFDLHILERQSAEVSYSYYQRHMAGCYYRKLSRKEKALLTSNILSCVQSDKDFSLSDLQRMLERYYGMSHEDLCSNLLVFKERIMPLADSLNLKIHFNSDNPCSNLLGLPSVSQFS